MIQNHRRYLRVGMIGVMCGANLSTGTAQDLDLSSKIRFSDPSLLCLPPTLSADQWRQLQRDNPRLLAPGQRHSPGQEFVSDAIVWVGNAQQGPSTRAQAARLTYSFPADGVTWGLPNASPTGPNDLNARLESTFPIPLSMSLCPSNSLDLGREYIRQALAAWQVVGGVTLEEVADDGSPMDENVLPSLTRGDIRIGGLDLGGSYLAYNAFPSNQGVSSIGGSDMVLDTSFFSSLFADPSGDYRFFRHTVAHEHGHGLGYIHVAPCAGSQIMEPIVPFGGLEPLRVDERRGVGRNYGDRFAGNHDQWSAAYLGSLSGGIAPSLFKATSIIEQQLSLNGANGFGNTDRDWFSFDLANNMSVQITVDPTGGSYVNGEVGFDCMVECDASSLTHGVDCTVNASAAGNLALDLYSGWGPMASADNTGPGGSETITMFLHAGAYYVRARDVGPNPVENQIVQLYDLTLRAGTAPARPRAVAGLSKRVAQGALAFFIGDIHSTAIEPGSSLVTYSWDLDGNGSFEIKNNPRPYRCYHTTGIHPVTLRVTDSNKRTDTDTIMLTVY